MRDLASLLTRVREALGSDTGLRAAVKEAVLECVHAPIEDSDFNVKSGVLTITASPMFKSELRLKEASVLECLEGKIGRKVTKVVYY